MIQDRLEMKVSNEEEVPFLTSIRAADIILRLFPGPSSIDLTSS
jgi:hypothetical protein